MILTDPTPNVVANAITIIAKAGVTGIHRDQLRKLLLVDAYNVDAGKTMALLDVAVVVRGLIDDGLAFRDGENTIRITRAGMNFGCPSLS